MRIRRVLIGIRPNRDTNSATNVCLDTLRLMGSLIKSRRKVVEKVSCLTEGVYKVVLCVSRSTEKKSFLRKVVKLGSNHTVKFFKGAWRHEQNRDREDEMR